MWLLMRLGYGAGVSRTTFYEYIKSLRKLGIPFGQGSIKSQDKTLADYTYCDVMELAITLSLRVYHVVPDSVLREIIRNRARLHQLYRRSYTQRQTGNGSPTFLVSKDGRSIEMRGLFLDLGIRFSGGQLVKFGPLKLLSRGEALALSARRMTGWSRNSIRSRQASSSNGSKCGWNQICAMSVGTTALPITAVTRMVY
jgi:hypothetical protein